MSLQWVLMAVAAGLAAAGEARAELQVVATSKPIHALVAGVMDGIGTPQLLVGGSASPHSYAMKPSDARKLAGADVLFRVSEDLEPFTRRIVRSLPDTVRVVTLQEAPGLVLLRRRTGGTFEGHDHAGHGQAHSRAGARPAGEEAIDPHIWLDPENAKAMVVEIASVLAAVAPDARERIAENAAGLGERLDRLSAEIARELAPAVGKPFAVYHDAYQYFEMRYRLEAVGSLTVNPDTPPGGKRLQELRRKLEATGAACVFAEPQFEARVTNSLVAGTKVRSGTLDPEGTALAPGPELYFTLLRNLSAALLRCLAPA